MLSYLKNLVNENNLFQCFYCFELFDTKQNNLNKFNEHVYYCSKKKFDKIKINNIDLYYKKFECLFCHQLFDNKKISLFTKHVLDDCIKNPKHIKKDSENNLNLFKYFIDNCGKKNNNLSLIEKKEKITAVKNFKKSENIKKRAYRSRHERFPLVSNISDPLTCILCKRFFRTKYTYRMHLLLKHSENYTKKMLNYSCPYCEVFYEEESATN